MGIRIGVQLYTLRKFLKKTENFDAVFARVAAMGADSVQVSGTCAFDSGMMRDLSQKYNLPVCVTHSPVSRIENDLDRLAEEHLDFGCPEIGIGMMPLRNIREKMDGAKRFTEFLNVTAAKLKPYNLKIAYHNHSFEMKRYDGTRVLDYMLDNTGDNVRFIPDTYWIKVGGADPAAYLQRMGGRVDVLHLKDYRKGRLFAQMCALGAGTFDFKEILTVAEAGGATDAVIELDYAKDPYAALTQSIAHLRGLGF